MIPVSLQQQVATLAVVILPFLGVMAAMFSLWGIGFNAAYAWLLLGFYFVTVIGITVGFHRYFTHRAFEAHPAVRSILAILGSMAVQGSLFKWVSMHRLHHHHSDQEQDPHSPHRYGSGVHSALKGAWHAHMGWFFEPDPANLNDYIKDLRHDPVLQRIDALFPFWVMLTLLLPALAGGLLTMQWRGLLLGLIWGGLVRVFLVHHVTWSINSICHIWGSRQHPTKDESRNNVVMGVLALGEGWHNNHHAYPYSAKHGFCWWQLDVSYYVICGLQALRLVSRVRRAPKADSSISLMATRCA